MSVAIVIGLVNVELVVIGIGVCLEVAGMRVGEGVGGCEVIFFVEVPHV